MMEWGDVKGDARGTGQDVWLNSREVFLRQASLLSYDPAVHFVFVGGGRACTKTVDELVYDKETGRNVSKPVRHAINCTEMQPETK